MELEHARAYACISRVQHAAQGVVTWVGHGQEASIFCACVVVWFCQQYPCRCVVNLVVLVRTSLLDNFANK